MIPQLNQSGVLPPFLPNSGPTIAAAMAPYPTDFLEIVSRFANTPARIEILYGLLKYRQTLSQAGIIDGFQWIDGSYVENCEMLRGRPPSDIDIVTFAERPAAISDNASWSDFVRRNYGTLFDRQLIKKLYHCDAYYQDLSLPGRVMVSRARYWFGLFSHQRVTNLWKGLLQVPLNSNDQAAFSLLTGTGGD